MKWLLQNAKDRIRRGLMAPGYSAGRLIHHLGGADERFLAAATSSTTRSIRSFIDAPAQDDRIAKHLKECIPALSETPDPICYLYAKKALIQFAVARALRPDVIVETGVANGISSLYWLLACHLNGKGHLYSIDIDSGEYLPPGKSTGWIVPGYLRDRWSLMLGNASDNLPELLTDLPSVDIFMHDSCHSYEHMTFEFEQAYPKIRSGGLLMSDDVDFNRAFSDFVSALRPGVNGIVSGVGILRK